METILKLSLLVFVQFWICGCTSVRVLKSVELEPEIRNERYEANINVDSITITNSGEKAAISIRLSGKESKVWEQRSRREERQEVSVRTYDTPTFARITKKVPPYTWTQQWFDRDYAYYLTSEYGVFPLTSAVDWEKVYQLSVDVGFFPLGTRLANLEKHPFSAIHEKSKSADGRIDYPVFPCTLSGEQFNSFINTALYPIALIDTDFAANVVYAPFMLVLNPTIDLGAYAIDIVAMTSVAAGEAAFAVLPPAADLVAMTSASILDTAALAGVAAVDTAFSALAIVGDSLMWCGDALYPSKFNLSTNTTVTVGEWVQKSEKGVQPNWNKYKVRITCGEKQKVIKFSEQATAYLAIGDIRPNNYDVTPLQTLTFEVLDSNNSKIKLRREPPPFQVNFDDY